MALELKGSGDVFKVEMRERGPARVTVKVAPTNKDGKWYSSFVELNVWGGVGKDGKTTPGSELVHTLQERDKIEFTAYCKTDVWFKDGNPKPFTKLAYTATSLALAGAKNSGPLQQPDDSDSVPF